MLGMEFITNLSCIPKQLDSSKDFHMSEIVAESIGTFNLELADQ